MAEFDYISINATAEDIEKIATKNIDENVLNETSDNNSLPTSKAVYNTIMKFNGGGSIVVDQTYNPESENAQSGIAVAEAIKNKQDKFATVIYGDSNYPEGTITGIKFDYPWVSIVSGGGGDDGEGATLFLGEVSCSINKPLVVGEPLHDGCAATKGYVDKTISAKQEFFVDGDYITIANNTEYIANEEITNLTIVYPDTDFICSFNFTLASEGDITITLPESKYIGGVPSFANGETWELNIKNGIVVGGLVE